MKTKIPPWITSYFYSVGTINEIKGGKCNKIKISEDVLNYSEVLHKEDSLILLPKVIGVYQEREPAKATAKERKEIKSIEAKRDKIIEIRLLERWGIVDNNHPYLIHIGYDSNVFTKDTLKELLNDKMDRIGLSPISTIPNFFEKDQVILYDIIVEEMEMYSDDVSKVSAEERTVVRQKFIPRIEEIHKQLKPFGLIRNEFYFIKSYYD